MTAYINLDPYKSRRSRPRTGGASTAKCSCKNKANREFLRRSIECGRTIRRQPPVSTAETTNIRVTISRLQRVAGRSARAVEPTRLHHMQACPWCRVRYQTIGGGVPEWLNGAVSKTVERVSVPRVRISLPPPISTETTLSAPNRDLGNPQEARAFRHKALDLGRPPEGRFRLSQALCLQTS